MKNKIVYILIILAVISCNKTEKLDSIEKSIKKDEKVVQNRKTSKEILISENKSDTLIVEKITAIIYSPTESSVEKRMKEVREEDFYNGADDYLFYLSESKNIIEKQKIKIVRTKNNKILKFISSDKSVTLVKLNLEDELWGIYLFDPKLKPKKINMTDTEEEVKNYIK